MLLGPVGLHFNRKYLELAQVKYIYDGWYLINIDMESQGEGEHGEDGRRFSLQML